MINIKQISIPFLLVFSIIAPLACSGPADPEQETIKPLNSIPTIEKPLVSDTSSDLLERIELLENQVKASQQIQNRNRLQADNNNLSDDQRLHTSTDNHNPSADQTLNTSTDKNNPSYDQSLQPDEKYQSNLESYSKPSGEITILNHSSYSTEDIHEWVSYAESKMASRKSNILAWIYPVGDMIRPEQEIEGMPFIKHEVMLKNSEIDILMDDIESWLRDDECMGHREENEHLKDELDRFRAWFEQGADASTQAALCEETRIIAMGITENMREHEPLFNFQDFLIHEFYHAFQQDLAMPGQCERKTRQPGSNTLWFVEGAANYFSQTVVAEIQGSDYPFRSAWDRMLEIAWEVHNMENVTEIDGGPVDKTGAIALRLLIEKGMLTESEIMDGSLFHNCARELVYDRNSPEIQHVKQSWHLIEHTKDGFHLKAEAYIP